jgi:hypothetical protein
MALFTTTRHLIVTLVCSSALLVPTAFGADQESHHEDGHKDGHSFHPNLLMGFVGITGEDRRDRALTLGLDYQRRFSERFSLGVGVEHAFGDLDFTVVTIPFVLHHKEWKFFAAPGVEKSDHHDDENLIRVGVEYAFYVGDLELAPRFMLDFIDGDTVVIGGLGIGKGF